jgi:hypothetical protein
MLPFTQAGWFGTAKVRKQNHGARNQVKKVAAGIEGGK